MGDDPVSIPVDTGVDDLDNALEAGAELAVEEIAEGDEDKFPDAEQGGKNAKGNPFTRCLGGGGPAKPKLGAAPNLGVGAGGALASAAALTGVAGGGGNEVYIPPQERSRQWEMTFQIRNFENVTSKKMAFFFAISIRSAMAKRRARIHLPPVYTTMFTLDKGQAADLEKPIIMIQNRRFRLPYMELEKHVLQIDMWQVSNWTFNEYFGTQNRTLYQCATSSMSQDLMIKKKMSRQEIADKKKPYDVARFQCSINIEEVFDFKLSFDNWTFKPDPNHPEANEWVEKRTKLTFSVPKTRMSKAELHKGCSVSRTNWNEERGKFFWEKPGIFTFTGTRTHLQNQYIVISAHSADPPEWIDTGNFPGQVIGRALMGLTSVLDISVFKARVKALTQEAERFRVGELVGNIKVQELSRGMKRPETDVKERPEQPKGSGMVSHLSPKEQYLVVRISKCENLPIADFDTGSADPYLRIAWDGMVQFSAVLQRTCRPVFNFTLFFPVRLVFPQMRTVKKYKTTALQRELESKGPVGIQVWDDDETSSDYLGGYALELSDILGTKNKQIRALTGPIKNAVEVDPDDDFAPPKNYQWFEKEEMTRVFDGAKTEIKGSSLPNQGGGPPTVHFEAYFWPDWEADVKIGRGTDEEGTDEAWKRLETEWNEKNELFRVQYAGPFSDSIGAKPLKFDYNHPDKGCRRFICNALHPQTRAIVPLPAFLCPIIIPQELCMPATLLHWLNCFPYQFPAKQDRSGLMGSDSMKNAAFILARRKGPSQDHATLLACILLGCKRNAYVCKGLLQSGDKLVEHCWVATLEKDKSVTFWEPSTLRRYTLPKRWDGGKGKRLGLGKMLIKDIPEEDWAGEPYVGKIRKRLNYVKKLKKERKRPCDMILEKIDKSKGNQFVLIDFIQTWFEMPPEQFPSNAQPDLILEIMQGVGLAEEEVPGSTVPVWVYSSMLAMDVELEDGDHEDQEEKNKKVFDPLWDTEVDDVKIAPEFVEIQVVGRAPRGKQKAKAAAGGSAKLGRDALKAIIMKKAQGMIFAPNKALLIENETLVTDLPYASLDIIWNTSNVWANRQNHHPACIMFNIDEPLHWEPFLSQKEAMENKIQYIDDDVVVPPALKAPIVDRMTQDILIEMKENMRLYRARKGLDCYFEERWELCSKLDYFLDLQEERLYLDPFFCPEELREKCQVRYEWEHPPAQESQASKPKVEKEWRDWEKRYQAFMDGLEDFPIKKGKKFRAYPIHFSTADIESIRNYLSDVPEYRTMIEWPDDSIYYTVQCKVFPLLGGILSVWFMIGTQTSHDQPFFDGQDVLEIPIESPVA